jgi:hypothetical protein
VEGPLVPRGRNCSICQVEIEGYVLRTRDRAKQVGCFCSPKCADAFRALSAISDLPLSASHELRKRRETIFEALLAKWRRGEGPDPSTVRLAAERARAVPS